MLILKGATILAKTTQAISTMEKRMRGNGESILDNVRMRKRKTFKWDDFIIY